MPFIKKIVMHGFKSFSKETEIPFEQGLNTIVGPNGGGKSNITDAICFVLGRLSLKSIRATKAANLIYHGGKENKPAFEARVDMILDNSDKIFPLGDEVKVSRIVRRNGISIYRINDETKTRQEVLDLFAHANIDPYGFNIILQGEIARLIDMRSEERRKIIEDVAGISIYETRKEKSLRELEKTGQKMSEINTILNERFAYMKNLDREREEALKYKELELNVKRCKASILKRDMAEKEKEIKAIEKNNEEITSEINKIKAKIDSSNNEIASFEEKIKVITQRIHKAGGEDQEALRNSISDLKAEITWFTVRKENYENQIRETEKKNEELQRGIQELQKSIEENKKGFKAYSDKELREKKKELEEIEEKRKKFYVLKTELNSLNERISDKKKSLQKIKNDSEFTFNQISQLSQNLEIFEFKKAKSLQQELRSNLSSLAEKENLLQKEIFNFDKEIAVCKSKIENLEKIKSNIGKLDICPTCNTKITKEHARHVIEDTNKKIEEINLEFENKKEKNQNNEKEIRETRKNALELTNKLNKINSDVVKLESVEEKREHISKLNEEEKIISRDIEVLSKKSKNFELDVDSLKGIEDKYDALNLEVTELMRREEANIGSELSLKQRDTERSKLIIKQNQREIELQAEKIKKIEYDLEEKQAALVDNEKQEKEQQEKFQQTFAERTGMQKLIDEKTKKIFELHSDVRINEEKINNNKILKAKVSAEYEALDIDFSNYKELELINATRQILVERLERTKQTLERMGNVNLHALEVYESVKSEYDSVLEKANKLKQEKDEIVKIIEEIDKKKKSAYMKTLNTINDYFTENFIRLSNKGQAFLELENKEDPFAGGLDITVRLAKGKYFDAAGLSGGEQTLVALSLIFAIQRYKPYYFYILDEIDAALDKRNSERLSSLINQNVKLAQYIVITHNDAIMSESPMLYGVTMQEGISKIVSLKI